MTKFTDSPFERLMQEKPMYREKKTSSLSEEHPCYSCNYRKLDFCSGVCYRDLILTSSQKKVKKCD